MNEILYIANDVLPALWRGLLVSLALIAPSMVFGLMGGILLGAARVYGPSGVRSLSNGIVLVFRGFPLVIQLYIWYFGLPRIGIYLSPYTASVLGFVFCSAAYHSEYIRGALLSIRRGQLFAGQAIGLSSFQTIRYVIMPQAIRRALPGCGNEIIYLIKYSSLAYMITCIELTGEGKIVASASFKYFEVFMIVGAIYLLLVSIASHGLEMLENRLVIPGFERYRS
ncbi:amino acid ABC transporter permease [Desulfatirhabdium butyrativorans]|uniref:amino acid ABC transporter permease n=1 Tax=Desulfatirhabdium butyrativorans TaxID=340467 RepID=UPI00040DD693|nr:amino acid ABC transporter permease [Desulfatirhabdium butyrativorans]